ncbi:hypothetical protein HK104_011438 [Borealophlyctis nickersoniae]|nr:hypothetical protein HK104_011438 [Borealophlyctis nickersoniae]
MAYSKHLLPSPPPSPTTSAIRPPRFDFHKPANQIRALLRFAPSSWFGITREVADGVEVDSHDGNEEYHLTGAEIDIFERFGEEIVRDYVEDGDVLIEAWVQGSFDDRHAQNKVTYLLQSRVDAKTSITYYAADLSKTIPPRILRTNLPQHPLHRSSSEPDELAWAAKNIPTGLRKMYLWLGSSIRNLTRPQAADFLRTVNKTPCQPRNFIMNGLDHKNVLFNQPVFRKPAFEYVSIYNAELGRHEAYYKSLKCPNSAREEEC